MEGQHQRQACLEAKGFLVVDDGTGSLQVRSPNDDTDPVPAMHACDKQLQKAGLLPDPAAPPSTETLRARYTTLLGIQACMTAHGYRTSVPPGVENFVDARGDWHPYDSVLLKGPAPAPSSSSAGREVGKLFEDCPDR